MIQVQQLTKRFKDVTALDDVSFVAEPGKVTGFLGPNGAGKTTTMRIMVGLSAPSSGSVLVGGHRYADIPNPGLHVGVLLDAGAQHKGRTGREILTVGAKTMGLPASRVNEMLEAVSLTAKEADRHTGDYSLGMMQRLGIAHALLGDPQVLILDEPANGLDPAGIRWMRGLLRGYAERGGTVLLSSHLLHEVEQIADEIVMIGHGRIVASGTASELLAGGATTVNSRHPARLLEALTAAGIDTRRTGSNGTLTVDAPTERVGEIAAEERIVLTELRQAQGGLEDLFLELTSGTQRDKIDERETTTA